MILSPFVWNSSHSQASISPPGSPSCIFAATLFTLCLSAALFPLFPQRRLLTLGNDTVREAVVNQSPPSGQKHVAVGFI